MWMENIFCICRFPPKNYISHFIQCYNVQLVLSLSCRQQASTRSMMHCGSVMDLFRVSPQPYIVYASIDNNKERWWMTLTLYAKITSSDQPIYPRSMINVLFSSSIYYTIFSVSVNGPWHLWLVCVRNVPEEQQLIISSAYRGFKNFICTMHVHTNACSAWPKIYLAFKFNEYKLSGETTLPKLFNFSLPSQKGSTLKDKELFPIETNSFSALGKHAYSNL